MLAGEPTHLECHPSYYCNYFQLVFNITVSKTYNTHLGTNGSRPIAISGVNIIDDTSIHLASFSAVSASQQVHEVYFMCERPAVTV